MTIFSGHLAKKQYQNKFFYLLVALFLLCGYLKSKTDLDKDCGCHDDEEEIKQGGTITTDENLVGKTSLTGVNASVKMPISEQPSTTHNDKESDCITC